MKLRIGFSSCPNDTFIFDALVHKKIDTCGIDFEYQIADVQELNSRALCSEFDVLKLSYFAFTRVWGEYQILDSGSALGHSNGPLFVCAKGNKDAISSNSIIALPGENTTAHLLFSMAFPLFTNKRFIIFSDIEKAMLNHEVDAGVIIHENRFTYAQRGFECIADLGEFWEQKTAMPIPLGCIAIKKSLDDDCKQLVNKLIEQSIRYALAHPYSSKEFIFTHSQEIEEQVLHQHIALFVNEYSLQLGIRGKQAIRHLFAQAQQVGIIPELSRNLFLNP